MLLLKKFFKTFTKKELVDAHDGTEVLNALSVESRAKVDEMTRRAIEAGGREARDPEDHGWMYARAIEDLDGHIWEFFYADEGLRK